LMISRQRAKLERDLGSIADLTRLPSAIFIIDIIKEHIAVKEATRLGIPTFAIVDTNANPKDVDFAIPGNDDAAKAIELVVKAMTDAIAEGLAERKAGKGKEGDAKDDEDGDAEVEAPAKKATAMKATVKAEATVSEDEDEE